MLPVRAQSKVAKMRNQWRSITLVLIGCAITAAPLSVRVRAAPVPVANDGPMAVDRMRSADTEHSPSRAVKDTCFQCHSVVEGTSVAFKDDVHYHNAMSCADCHGGDPKEDDQNLSMSAKRGFKIRVKRQAMPDYCGRCHKNASFMGKFQAQPRVDQLALYKRSVHAKGLAAGRGRGAECV